jgi:nicotinate-nucleotide pyrophosphorylase (carboxylating)
MLEKQQIQLWLDEDIQSGDITTEALIPDDQIAEARIVAKEDGIACGLEAISQISEVLGTELTHLDHAEDGTALKKGEIAARFKGPYSSLLKAERCYLNLVQHLCGIATITKTYSEAVAHTRAKILDTRKTIPGLRMAAKRAVRAGGGHNHRIGLYDAFLIKENHIAAFRHLPNPFLTAIETARRLDMEKPVIIEVENLEEMNQALEGMPDVILLDNMSLDDMRKAVEKVESDKEQVELEASGGITLERLKAVAETGVHRISVGAITHSAMPMDLSMLIEIH